MANDPALASRGLTNVDCAVGVVAGEQHNVGAREIQNVSGLHVGVPVVLWFSGNLAKIARAIRMPGRKAPGLRDETRTVDTGCAGENSILTVGSGRQSLR